MPIGYKYKADMQQYTSEYLVADIQKYIANGG